MTLNTRRVRGRFCYRHQVGVLAGPGIARINRATCSASSSWGRSAGLTPLRIFPTQVPIRRHMPATRPREKSVRNGLSAGGKRIRTRGPCYKADAFESILVAWLAFVFLPEKPTRSQGGTDGSNPLSSSGESCKPSVPQRVVGRSTMAAIRSQSLSPRHIDQPELRQHRGLVPVDMFVRELTVAEMNDDNQSDLEKRSDASSWHWRTARLERSRRRARPSAGAARRARSAATRRCRQRI